MKYHSPFSTLAFCFLLLFSNNVFAQTVDQQHFKVDYLFAQQHVEEQWSNLSLTANGLQTQNPDQFGQFVSRAIKIPLTGESPFLAFSMVWQLSEQQVDALVFQIKGSTNGVDWEEWEAIKQDEHGPASLSKSVSQLLLLDAHFTFLKIKIDFPKNSFNQLQHLSLHFFNPGNSSQQSANEPLINEQADACICPAPLVLGRNDWCPTGDCSPNPNPDSTEVTHLIIHHSATSNAASDWAAVVRSIWDFHVNTWGWSDIGYNWLIDPNGQLYEGRGQAIQGAHFCGKNAGTTGVCMLGDYQVSPPSNETQQTLQKFLSWQSCLEDIDPLGTSLHVSSNLNLFHISGHRDGCNTECPGNAFYPLVAGIRQGVQNYISNSCTTVSNDFPTFSASLDVKIFPNPNTGLFQLQHNSKESGQATLFTIQGQKIWTKNISASPLQALKVSALVPGIYWLQLSFSETSIYQKMVIQ